MKAVNFGIDLGTTNSLIAKYEAGQVQIFKNPIGHKETLASVVAFRPDRTLVGDKAREYILKDSVNVFGGFKRKMGTDERYYVVNLDENVTPVQLSAYVLKELQQFVHTGEKPSAAVITIPASFDTMQSNATIKAGEEAGFSHVYLLQEPIAASLAYFNFSGQAANMPDGHWLVYDLGGGTFDVALVGVKDGALKVIDHEGNNFLGGMDFDAAIIDHFVLPHIIEKTGIAHFEEELKTAYGKYEHLYFLLQHKAEEAKKELSIVESTFIECSFNLEDTRFDFEIQVTREEFNRIIAKRVDDTINMLHSILQRNQLAVSEISSIILVGGSTFIPYVRERLVEGTGIKLDTRVDPTTAVAVGAAWFAANKYYQPTSEEIQISNNNVDELLDSLAVEMNQTAVEAPQLTIATAYSKMCQDEEEVLVVKVTGDYSNCSYRITRTDGGFDTGMIQLKAKFTEFLPILPGLTNVFTLRIYDPKGNELRYLAEEISITQGRYSIAGQPLPRDICIEVDDKENNTTKLELIFEKNSILPQKKTLYREISKTIKKGDNDSLIINILEGDRHARPISNLVIGCIEISGKQLSSDLLKGSDVEIQVTMTESRELKTEVFLVMTEQEYKNSFSISEKQVNIARLIEQFEDLEIELRETIKSFNHKGKDVWAVHANTLLDDLLTHKVDLKKLKANDKTDRKYIIAEAVYRISQELDKIGGDDRLEDLRAEYLHVRDYIEEHLPMADFDKEKTSAKFKQILQGESQLLRTRNASVLERVTSRLNELAWDILYNSISFLIAKFEQFKHAPESDFTNHNAAKSIFAMADKALEQQRFAEFRQHVYNLTHLLKHDEGFQKSKEFKGTGIG
jgi:molecular chaperone DnaK